MTRRPSDWSKAQPPLPHQKGWIKVIEAGCQGTRDYWGEFDCMYPWGCENCPVCIEAERKRAELFIGPPKPEYFEFE